MNDNETLGAELRSIAEDIASSIGREILERRAAGFAWETKSSSTDVVTEIDTWAETAIVEAITNLRPNDGFLGEEGVDTPGSSGVRWVIDPVDGTTNLLYNISGYNVSIGAELNGVAIAGAVYDPVRAEVFSAAKGQGATLNGEPISASDQVSLGHSLVATGFGYDADLRRKQATWLVEILPEIRDIRRSGAAAIDLCSVACGRVDAYFELNTKPWDRAAGALIATEAGAIVTEGEPTIAVAPGVSNEFRALLERSGT